jgi:hypothetical protein
MALIYWKGRHLDTLDRPLHSRAGPEKKSLLARPLAFCFVFFDLFRWLAIEILFGVEFNFSLMFSDSISLAFKLYYEVLLFGSAWKGNDA